MRESTGGSSAPAEHAVTVEPWTPEGVVGTNEPSKPNMHVAILAGVFDCLGIPGSTSTATKLLAHFGSLSAVLNADGSSFILAGIVDDRVAKSLTTINCLFEARWLETLRIGPQVFTTGQLEEIALRLFRGKAIEEALILFFNDKYALLPQRIRYLGSINQVNVYQSEILRTAINLRALNIAIIHNHPSGDPRPSREDIAETQQLQSKLALLEISLLDHLIVGANTVVSMRRAKVI